MPKARKYKTNTKRMLGKGDRTAPKNGKYKGKQGIVKQLVFYGVDCKFLLEFGDGVQKWYWRDKLEDW